MKRTEFYDAVSERMIRYAKINTESTEESNSWPTTECQFDLARELYDELIRIGASDVYFDDKECLVYAKIPGTTEVGEPVAFVAHMDTAPDASGKNVKPWVLEDYDGGDIVLNEEKGIVMRTEEFKNLELYVGQDLILTDGTTLLGGDDKASIAAIMTAAEYMIKHPELPRRTVCLAFSPDEEVGGGAHALDLERLGAKAGYTLDGDHLGQYQDETFNASEATVEIRGLSVHTATAKGIMKNAVDIANQFISMMPAREKPQYTDGVEGFFHLISCNSSVEYAKIVMNIRDFDPANFAARENLLGEIATKLNEEFGEGTVTVSIKEQYRNMKEKIDEVPYLVSDLKKAITESGLTPVCEPFRGGTDGSQLSFRGLPCPNLSAGYENAHGRFEYVPIHSMEKNVEILLRLCTTKTEF